MVVNSICSCTRAIMLILKIMHNVNSFDTREVHYCELANMCIYVYNID